jgi:hypothetical protein
MDARLGPSLRRDALFRQRELTLKSISVSIGHRTTTALALSEWPELGLCLESVSGNNAELAPEVFEFSWLFRHFTFVGTEFLQVEAGLGGKRLNHFAQGDFHVWSEPATGLIVRLWQSSKGLTVFPEGLIISKADEVSFADDFFAPRCQVLLRARGVRPLVF